MTLVVTGSGRSGTHWLAHVLGQFIDARHEPAEIGGDVTVCCRQATRLERIARQYRTMQLVRDGRDVCRSQFTAFGGRRDWERICRTWADVVTRCDDHGLRSVRLEDLLARQDASGAHLLPHWSEWSDEHTETFWMHCGDVMQRHGYGGTP